jgi:hypothetical protein
LLTDDERENRAMRSFLSGSLGSTTAALCFLALPLGMAGCGKAVDSGSGEQVGLQAKPTSTEPPLETGDPATVPGDVLKTMLEGVPAEVRRGQTDVELARDLGIRAWVIEFTGGPISCSLDVKETGQQTTETRLPGPVGFSYTCQGDAGRIYMGFRPGASERNASARSQRLAKRLNRGDTVHQLFTLFGAASSRETAADPGKPRWWASWNDVSLKETARETNVKGRTEVTLLAIEATEKDPPPGAQPRQVKLALKAQPAPGR